MGFGRDLINSHEGLLKLQDWELKYHVSLSQQVFTDYGGSEVAPLSKWKSLRSIIMGTCRTPLKENTDLQQQSWICSPALHSWSFTVFKDHRSEKAAEVFW
ncbi:hypothetical protein ILYODFUR_032842 [Ilyodon furcidens]|uniref:Uncharacterized protein n=1 Tax=Ilyodon furcidens TaxID=33524 RepID=A0ABV0TEU9_9TELE